mmetsp:Transcript_44487/g.144419  ORF Transcript_44487/g.144419 Transcript_44487/m.144419 type:complete len:226 (+) Transcript_44487:127-804(+)
MILPPLRPLRPMRGCTTGLPSDGFPAADPATRAAPIRSSRSAIGAIRHAARTGLSTAEPSDDADRVVLPLSSRTARLDALPDPGQRVLLSPQRLSRPRHEGALGLRSMHREAADASSCGARQRRLERTKRIDGGWAGLAVRLRRRRRGISGGRAQAQRRGGALRLHPERGQRRQRSCVLHNHGGLDRLGAAQRGLNLRGVAGAAGALQREARLRSLRVENGRRLL